MSSVDLKAIVASWNKPKEESFSEFGAWGTPIDAPPAAAPPLVELEKKQISSRNPSNSNLQRQPLESDRNFQPKDLPPIETPERSQGYPGNQFPTQPAAFNYNSPPHTETYEAFQKSTPAYNPEERHLSNQETDRGYSDQRQQNQYSRGGSSDRSQSNLHTEQGFNNRSQQSQHSSQGYNNRPYKSQYSGQDASSDHNNRSQSNYESSYRSSYDRASQNQDYQRGHRGQPSQNQDSSRAFTSRPTDEFRQDNPSSRSSYSRDSSQGFSMGPKSSSSRDTSQGVSYSRGQNHNFAQASHEPRGRSRGPRGQQTDTLHHAPSSPVLPVDSRSHEFSAPQISVVTQSTVLDWVDHPEHLDSIDVLELFAEVKGTKGIRVQSLNPTLFRLTFGSADLAQQAQRIFLQSEQKGFLTTAGSRGPSELSAQSQQALYDHPKPQDTKPKFGTSSSDYRGSDSGEAPRLDNEAPSAPSVAIPNQYTSTRDDFEYTSTKKSYNKLDVPTHSISDERETPIATEYSSGPAHLQASPNVNEPRKTASSAWDTPITNVPSRASFGSWDAPVTDKAPHGSAFNTRDTVTPNAPPMDSTSIKDNNAIKEQYIPLPEVVSINRATSLSAPNLNEASTAAQFNAKHPSSLDESRVSGIHSDKEKISHASATPKTTEPEDFILAMNNYPISGSLSDFINILCPFKGDKGDVDVAFVTPTLLYLKFGTLELATKFKDCYASSGKQGSLRFDKPNRKIRFTSSFQLPSREYAENTFSEPQIRPARMKPLTDNSAALRMISHALGRKSKPAPSKNL